MAVPTYTKSGTKAATPAKLDKNVFDVAVENHDLLKQAYLSYLANGRENNAIVKTRGLVRGGGRKPWRQKGTGRARFGSSRNPIWRGGGIVFGPTGNENYSRKLNTSTKRTALRQALSIKAGTISVIDSIDSNDGKTKPIVALLNKLGCTKNTLVIVEDKTDMLVRACRNIPSVTLVQASYVNVYDVLNADSIIFTKKALDVVNEWLGSNK